MMIRTLVLGGIAVGLGALIASQVPAHADNSGGSGVAGVAPSSPSGGKSRNSGRTVIVKRPIIIGSGLAPASPALYPYVHGESYVSATNHTGEIGEVALAAEDSACATQMATVVKSIHAECVADTGEHQPAIRMGSETLFEGGQASEIYRCLDGSRLTAKIGDAVQGEHGLAGTYKAAQTLSCKAGEALRQLENGTVTCAPAGKIAEETVAANMSKNAPRDVLFTFEAKVCAQTPTKKASSKAPEEAHLSGMTLDGGVGN